MKVYGVSDEITTCEQCGKTNLKRTVAIGDETGVKHYGTTCAARVLRKSGHKVNKSALETEVTMIYYAQSWRQAGYDSQVIREGIWNKFGFMCEVRDGMVKVEISTGVIFI